jgi:RimJ/RimL family protein N-acetyltransferase
VPPYLGVTAAPAVVRARLVVQYPPVRRNHLCDLTPEARIACALVRLRAYTDDDLWLTEALETDPAVMRELGGPTDRDRLPEIHRRRVADPWWFTIVTDSAATPVGTIGVWETSHGGERLHETGWMVLPAHQGRGIASAALAVLIARVGAEPGIPSMHAFPPVTNLPSNALCRKFGFVLLGAADFDYAGRTLRCNHWSLATPRGSRAASRRPAR